MTTQTTSKLDNETKAIIQATVPVLQEYGNQITKRFYELMLGNHPELKNIFNMTNQRKGDQPKALANTVYAAAANIDNLENILPVVKQIAHKHKSLNIKPDQYPIVGKYLLLAIKDVLDDVATDDIMEAWEKAYAVIADVFISVERDMYQETLNKVGGWTDFRDFKVVKKAVESDVITSFYLEPVDGKPFPSFEPGQYITVKVNVDGSPYTHLRQYSLSCSPEEGYYRISVKREDGVNGLPNGVVSTHLHNNVHVGSILPISAPSGDFFLDQTDQRPLVLMSGGVGLTPMMSMLETAVCTQPERDIIFVHAAHSSILHAMKDRVVEISEKHPNVKHYVIYSDPCEGDQCDKVGHIDAEWLHNLLPTNDAAFYFCGPKGFMRTVYHILKSYNVSDTDIHFEIFGPAEDITDY
ncbi:NO-inducible flavohemoprotein [Lentibacillus saliphilus]|uniref:NO-inducible flavohemoprotein n=1 Tax=Lentibacillus saliphilus TaxID=2737028 RepID=UPI001C308AED|nr:NO-inducible flavohemoprotein [Lentibacillus saliphilus]